MYTSKIEPGELSLFNGSFSDKPKRQKRMSEWQKLVEFKLASDGAAAQDNLHTRGMYDAFHSSDYFDHKAIRCIFVDLFEKIPTERELIPSDDSVRRYVTVGDDRIDFGETFDIVGTYNAVVDRLGGNAYMVLMDYMDGSGLYDVANQDEDSGSVGKCDSDPGFLAFGSNDTRTDKMIVPSRSYTQDYRLLVVIKGGVIAKMCKTGCLIMSEIGNPVAGEFVRCVMTKNANAYKSISYIVHTSTGYDDIRLPIRSQTFDLKLQYNDDMPDKTIKSALENDGSGILLFHGPPGTGKTSYIRHLALTLGSKFVFFDRSMFGHMAEDGFMRMLSRFKGSVIILEDCESLIEDRSQYNDAMSALLNLSDGILGDGFGIKFICTFNCPVEKIDGAVTRKGRLKVKYEFGPLSREKSQVLLESLGSEKKADGPMTLADIYGIDTDNGCKESVTVKKPMGF